eukprot:gene5183-3568_t
MMSTPVWPLISGRNATPPRGELAIGDAVGAGKGKTLRIVHIVRGRHKLLLGPVGQAGWSGPVYPNASSAAADPSLAVARCGDTPATGAGARIWDDPGEHRNLASALPEVFASMLARAGEIGAS